MEGEDFTPAAHNDINRANRPHPLRLFNFCMGFCSGYSSFYKFYYFDCIIMFIYKNT